ncbi:hypothetical protein D3C80_1193170 [compost metagenome]
MKECLGLRRLLSLLSPIYLYDGAQNVHPVEVIGPCQLGRGPGPIVGIAGAILWAWWDSLFAYWDEGSRGHYGRAESEMRGGVAWAENPAIGVTGRNLKRQEHLGLCKKILVDTLTVASWPNTYATPT